MGTQLIGGEGEERLLLAPSAPKLRMLPEVLQYTGTSHRRELAGPRCLGGGEALLQGNGKSGLLDIQTCSLFHFEISPSSGH